MIYVASSWRNKRQPEVVAAIREAGLSVYDFRNPREGDKGFHWSEIDKDWKSWSPEKFRGALYHPVAKAGFDSDMGALRASTACVLVLPCGRSAHLEMGYAVGRNMFTVILLEDGEPELMYRMVKRVCVNLEEVIKALTGS